MALTADFVTNKPTPFAALRYADFQGALQEGVVGAGDLMVTQRGAGANMTVDVAAGGGWVQIDTGTRNGMAHVVNDAVANATITAAHATLPRVDQIVLQYNDSAIPAGVGGDIPTLRVIAGVATTGATLDNRTGAGALPADALRLADVLVAAAATSVLNTSIRDRRPWARGAMNFPMHTGGDQFTTSATFVGIGTAIRLECSGVPVVARLDSYVVATTAAATAAFTILQDAAGITSGERQADLVTVSAAYLVGQEWRFTPTAGSHLFQPALRRVGGTGTPNVRANATTGMMWSIQEQVRQNAASNSVTSG